MSQCTNCSDPVPHRHSGTGLEYITEEEAKVEPLDGELHDFIVFFYEHTDTSLISAISVRASYWVDVMEELDGVSFVDLDYADGTYYLERIREDNYRVQVYVNG